MSITLKSRFVAQHLRQNLIAGFCALALLFAVAAAVEAQVADPILDDEIICSVTPGDTTIVAKLSLMPELEALYGQSATVESMHALLQRLPVASETNGVHFEGGHPDAVVVQGLEGLGYKTQVTLGTPVLPGAQVAYLRTR